MRILSLGAGVQSSTLALMAAHGEIDPVDHAIFADTQAEPASVYLWLDWLESEIQRCPYPFPVHRVTRGNLAEDSLKVRESKNGNRYQKHAPPMFTSNAGEPTGILMRQCTSSHKIEVIQRAAKKLAGKEPILMQIGISRDESHRAKPSRDKRIMNEFPLLDAGMYRGNCLEWMQAKGYPQPPRSSCVFCPYHSNAEWRRLRDHEPEAFAQAVEYEKRIKQTMAAIPDFAGDVWLHRELKPLAEIDLDDDGGQVDLFGNECEGMCGV